MSEANMKIATVDLKLIGAETYACRPAGIEFPVHAGDIVPVYADKVDHLLAQVYRVDSHEYPVWTKDLKAEVKTKGLRAIPIEQRRAMEAEEAERNAAFEKERAEKEAALEREEELKLRVDRLEALIEKSAGVQAEEPVAEKAPRKRAAKKKAA